MEFNIMGIDPGSRTLGVSIFTVKPTGESTIKDFDLEIMDIKTITLHIDNDTTGLFDNVTARTLKLKRFIKAIYYIYRPAMTSIESSFVNMSRLGAVLPLTKAIHTIESTLVELDRYAKIVSIPPGAVKKAFDSKQKGKDAVLVALKNKKELVDLIGDVAKISEHEVDAVAIAYTLLEYLKTTGGMVCIHGLQM